MGVYRSRGWVNRDQRAPPEIVGLWDGVAVFLLICHIPKHQKQKYLQGMFRQSMPFIWRLGFWVKMEPHFVTRSMRAATKK